MTRHESDAHAQNGEVDDDGVQQQQRLKRTDGEEEEGSGNDNQREGEDEGDEEEDLSFMPPIDELENLILEAYNNMQSDGEFIFLPDEVAQRLHQVAQMMQEANAGLEDDGDNQQNQSDTEDAGDAISDDETGASQSTESLQENDLQEPEEEDEERQEREQEQAARPPAKAPKQPLESKFMELPPVLEIDEEGSSDSHAGSPATEREIMNASPPPPPSSGSRRKTSSIPLPPPPHAPVPASPMKTSTKNASSPSVPSRLRAPRADTKVASYESRREAAQKLREDKALREQRARDSAKKQREDARRKLEEAHQRQLEEKRERVRRMKTQREGVKPVASRKLPSSTGSTGK